MPTFPQTCPDNSLCPWVMLDNAMRCEVLQGLPPDPVLFATKSNKSLLEILISFVKKIILYCDALLMPKMNIYDR